MRSFLLVRLGCTLGVLLLQVQPFLELEWCSWTMECSRSGPFAGTCHAVPSLRDRLGMSGSAFDPSDPRLSFLPVIPIDEITRGEPHPARSGCWTLYTKHGRGSANEGGDGWFHIPLHAGECGFDKDRRTTPEAVSRVVADFNDFLGSERERFRYHPRERLGGACAWIGQGTRGAGVLVLLVGMILLVVGRQGGSSLRS